MALCITTNADLGHSGTLHYVVYNTRGSEDGRTLSRDIPQTDPMGT